MKRCRLHVALLSVLLVGRRLRRRPQELIASIIPLVHEWKNEEQQQ